ncbi:MAG: carbohydrate-binding domain-containing protein [Clostridia bacterium]|nr:carbohydrate-binding domain-containing protein [Clostridia bacterium]
MRAAIYKALSITLCLFVLCLSGCGKKREQNNEIPQDIPQNNNNTSSGATVSADMSSMEFDLTDRDSKDTYSPASAKQINLSSNITDLPAGATLTDGILSITMADTYIISGEAENLCLNIAVPTDQKLQIVLNSAKITNNKGPAIFVKSAEKVFLTLADGSVNTLSDSAEYTQTDSDTTLDAALFSKEDITINGSGTLNVTGNFKHGIVSKDDLVVAGGRLNVTAKNVALSGKDCVKISNAAITLNAGTDGIRSDNEEASDKGFVYIKSGTVDITARNDGIQSVTLTKIDDGQINVKTGGGSSNASTNADNSFNENWGFGRPQMNNEYNSSATQTESAKAIKSGNTVIIGGGNINIDSADDSIHSNNLVEITGGSITVTSGDDGVHADTTLNISGSDLKISKSYEGIEATNINISGGNLDITASDDGINAAGGNDSSAMGRPGMNQFAGGSGTINISGGYVLVDASGDGIDSNGNILVSGGVTLVSGPTNSGNGAFDYQTNASVTGGVLIATGSLGMAQGFSSAENQGAILVSTSSAAGGSNVAVCYDNGKTVVSFTPKKAYQSVVVTAPGIKTSETYSIVVGGTVKNADENGYGENLEISGGNTVTTVTLMSNLYNASQGGFGGGDHGGGPGGMKPNMNGRPMK